MGIFSRRFATQSNVVRRYAGQEVQGKDLRTPQLTLMTVGGIIGSGLFLASGQAIRDAGPALFFAYLIGASAMAIEMTALAEMSAADPRRGSFLVYSREALGPGFTFVGGWIFWFSSVLNLAAEATAAATFAKLWLPGLPTWVMSSAFALTIAGINFLTVKGFGEVESSMSMVKLSATALFILLAAGVIFLGWPAQVGHGAAIWTDQGGFFPHGLAGVGAAMIVVMFSMSGTGVLGLAAADVRQPERTFRTSVTYVTVAVYVLYIGAALAVTGLIGWRAVPPTTKSPFIVALHALPWPAATQIFNVVILLAVLSAMNAGMFATDRVLAGLARAGDAPRALARMPAGIPRMANAVTGGLLLVVSLLTYFLPKTAFLYLVTATGFQAIFVWMLIVATQIYYRRHLEEHHQHRLRFKLPLHPWLGRFELLLLAAIVATAPLAPRQILPLGIGVGATALFAAIYLVFFRGRARTPDPT